jgi:hypothetical protein
MSLLGRLFGGVEEPAEVGDARVIDQLRAAGADLTQPLPVELFLSFPDERAARRVVGLLAGTGGELRIGPSGLGGGWSVGIRLPMVITPERIAMLRDRLGSLAEAHGGEVDGWGAPAR